MARWRGGAVARWRGGAVDDAHVAAVLTVGDLFRGLALIRSRTSYSQLPSCFWASCRPAHAAVLAHQVARDVVQSRSAAWSRRTGCTRRRRNERNATLH